jgi:hypothetical protein
LLYGGPYQLAVPVSDQTGAWPATKARSAALVTPGFTDDGAIGALAAIPGAPVLDDGEAGSSTGGGGA